MNRRMEAARVFPLGGGERGATMALAALAVMGLIVMAAATPATGQTRAIDDTIIQTSAPGGAAGSQETYRSRVRNEMADWRRRMQAFEDKTEARGKRQVDIAETRLRAAWDDTEVEARNLQVATAHDWEHAKRAYETASHRLEIAWDKVRL